MIISFILAFIIGLVGYSYLGWKNEKWQVKIKKTNSYMKKQEKEPLAVLISVKTSIKMKEGLMKLASDEERDFSDYLRLLWKKTLANAGKKSKKV